MHSPLKIKLTDLNPHLTCILCEGYFVNATTITECLHSFCRSCIVKYLETNKYCPICEVQIHKTKPLLNLRSDQTLQDIVYKLVPGLFQNEMQRRKTFYATNPSVTKPADPELSGELSERSYIYTSDDYISLSLEYYNNNNESVSTADIQSRRYLRCPAAVSILHLQKLIRAKYGLTKDHKVDILYQNDSLCEDFTLIDVAYIYLWKRKGPLHLTYRIFETECRKKVKYDFQKDDVTADMITDTFIKTSQPSITNNNEDCIKSSPTFDQQQPLINSSEASITTPTTASMVDDTLVKTTVSSNLVLNNPADNNKTNFLDNNIISTASSGVVTTSITDSSNYLNNNNIKSDKQQINDVVMCDNVVEPHPQQKESTTAAEDKEVHLQISETGIISVTTSLASSAEITQTVTTTSSIQSNSKLPITSINNSSTTVIPNIMRLKKSDLKSVRKNNAKSGIMTPTTVTQPVAVVSTATSTTVVESQTNERKRKLSTDSTENSGSSLKKQAIVSQQVPLNSDSNDMNSKSNKLINPPTSIPPSSTSATKSTTFNSKTTTIISPSTPRMSVAATTNIRKPPLINQQSITTPLIQPSIRPPSTTPSKLKISGPQTKSQPLPAVIPNSMQSKKPIGYKTLRNPPKAWNPTLPPRNLNHQYGGYVPNVESKLKASPSMPVTTTTSCSMTPSTNMVPPISSVSSAIPTTKPNKFFKVRNNMPRYLGNPASGVKPMYQISSPPATTTVANTTTASKSLNEVKVLNSMAPSATATSTTTSSSSAAVQNVKKSIRDTASPAKSLSAIAVKLNTKMSQIPPLKDSSVKTTTSSEPAVAPVVATPIPCESSVNKNNETSSQENEKVENTEKTPTVTESETKLESKSSNDTKTELPPVTTPTMTSTTTEKVFQPSRNSLKLSLSSRNSTMTVSEMLQLRNSPKTTNPPQITTKNDQKNSPSTETAAPSPTTVSETNTVSTSDVSKEETTKKDDSQNNVDEKSKSLCSDDKNELNKNPIKDVEKKSPLLVEEKVKDKESPAETPVQTTEKPNELKISQTSVPIYSPRFKQKNDSKFQKSINSNLRIDVHNIDAMETNSKLLYSPQVSPSLKIDVKKNKNVPSSPKFERVSSPKTLISPKSPKTIQKSSPTLQMNPIYDHKSKNPLSPQLDRMSPKINQMYKMSPTHTKQMGYEHKNSSKSGAGSSSNSTDTKSGNSKSPIVKNVCQLSPKTLPKTDLSVPSQQKFNFVPANPFIPNLSSPNLSPNFLFSNYAINAAMSSYENRLLPQHNCPKNMNSILELSAYHHTIPLMNAMFYNQHRLGYPGPPQSAGSALMGGVPSTVSPSSSATSSAITSSASQIINTSVTTNSKSVDSKAKQSKDKNLNTVEKK